MEGIDVSENWTDVEVKALFGIVKLGKPLSYKTLLPEQAPYLRTSHVLSSNKDGIDIYRITKIEAIDMPEEKKGIVYVVPPLARATIKGRKDLAIAVDPVFAKDGRLVCYRGIEI